MKLLVALSIASDTYSHVQTDPNGGVHVDESSWTIAPLDRQVLSKALSISPCADVFSACPDGAERAFRYAAAMGAQRLVRVNDCPCDAYVAASHLADVLKSESVDAVLCGQSGWDCATGDFPKWLSCITGIGLVEDVADFCVDPQDPGCLQVVCQTDTRRFSAKVSLPVVLSCTKAIYPDAQVRIPSMREMMLAMRAPVEVRQPKDAYAPKKIFSCFRPVPPRSSVRFLPADDFAALADILEDALAAQGSDVLSQDVPVFSGRILAQLETLGEPSPVPARLVPLWEETLPAHRDLKTAPLVLSGGMGVGADAWPLLDELAGVCGAAVACTRPVYQEGIRPYYEHVGQTGAKVAPQLYVAFGIRGALQHVAGMVRAARVLAVNTDPQAEIFKYSDYGVVGDVRAVLQGLLAEFRRRGRPLG